MGEPEWTEELTAARQSSREVVSSLEDCLGQKGVEPPRMMEEPGPADVGHLCWKGPCQGERSPPEDPGYCGHPGGRDRMAEPVCHQGPVRDPCPLQKLGLPQTEISGMEQEVLPSAAGGEPCPLLQISPSLEGLNIWRRWRGSPGFQPGSSTGVGTGGWLLPPGAGWKLGGGGIGGHPHHYPQWRS